MKKLLVLALVAIPALACTSETVVKKEAPGPTTPTEATGTIGKDGGSVEVDGVILEVPAGALDKEESIKITKLPDTAPEGYQAFSAIYQFEPEGLAFKLPAHVTFTAVNPGATKPTVAWGKEDGTFQGLRSTFEDGWLYADVKALHLGFVGNDIPTCACPSTCRNAAATGGDKMTCDPDKAPKTLPDQETIGNFIISSYEFWPWKEPEPIYPDKVLWGYSAGGPEARKCIAEARKVLVDILTNSVPPELEELRTKTEVRAFYQWNNDMTGADKSVKIPDGYQGLWLYEKRLIKWMSHTERDGSCRIPTRDDLVTFSKACLKDFPNCGSGKE